MLVASISSRAALGKASGGSAIVCGASHCFLLLSAWIVPPGQSFQPPDIHTGDEPYFVLRGVASVYNPETGQLVEAKAGSVVFIPAGCWHSTFNFGEEEMYLCAIIEGKPWSPKAMKLVEEAELKPVGYKNK